MTETRAESPQAEQELLRREIERTRAELGATVEALSHKADVKAQARQRLEQAKTQVRDKMQGAKSQAGDGAQTVQAQAGERPVMPVAAGIGVALVALFLIRRRK